MPICRKCLNPGNTITFIKNFDRKSLILIVRVNITRVFWRCLFFRKFCSVPCIRIRKVNQAQMQGTNQNAKDTEYYSNVRRVFGKESSHNFRRFVFQFQWKTGDKRRIFTRVLQDGQRDCCSVISISLVVICLYTNSPDNAIIKTFLGFKITSWPTWTAKLVWTTRFVYGLRVGSHLNPCQRSWKDRSSSANEIENFADDSILSNKIFLSTLCIGSYFSPWI